MAFFPCSLGAGEGFSEGFSAFGHFTNTQSDYLYIDTGVSLAKSKYFFVVIFPTNLSNSDQNCLVVEHDTQLTAATEAAYYYYNGSTKRNKHGTYPPTRGSSVPEWNYSGQTICIAGPTAAASQKTYPIVGEVYWAVL